MAVGENNIESSDVEQIASQTIAVEDAGKAGTLMRMIDALEDLDDVATVTANYDIAESILESL
jgi:transcriptional/translational regulatory protein YebC/TACO1